MKSLVLYACILIIAFQPSCSTELKKQLKNIVETIDDDVEVCLIENNMTTSDMYKEEDIMTNLYTQPENEERTRRVGCWIACVLKKQNLMEGSNIKETQVHIRINLILADKPNEGIAHKIARKCMKQVRNISQECEKSFSLLVCVAKVHKEIIDKYEEHVIEEAEGEAETEQTV